MRLAVPLAWKDDDRLWQEQNAGIQRRSARLSRERRRPTSNGRLGAEVGPTRGEACRGRRASRSPRAL